MSTGFCSHCRGIIERELEVRQGIFESDLEGFGERLTDICVDLFGGDGDQAQELLEELGFNPEEVEAQIHIVREWAQNRKHALQLVWADRIEQNLDAYANGRWHTSEMREACKGIKS